MDNTLSVCLIVKDEEKVVGNCLNSIKHIADEIIVVDTGSIDNTIEIVKNYNVKVIEHIWNDDFSEARNKSLEYATKDWILVLDADEEIDYNEGLLLKKMLIDYSEYEGFIMKLVNINDGKKDGSASVFRLFKNNPKYRFSGKIHEQVTPSIRNECENSQIGSCDISILHYGYDSKVVNLDKKSERNLKILNTYKEERDGYYYYSLANEYGRLKDWEQAIFLYKKGLELASKKDLSDIYVPYLYMNLIKALFANEKYMEVIDVITKAEKQFDGFKDLYLFKFLSYFKCGYYSQARIYLNEYLNTNNKRREYPTIALSSILGTSLESIVKIINENISHIKEDILSVVILSDKIDKDIEKSIVSVNEVSNDVVVLYSKENEIKKERLINLGAKIIEIDSNNKEEIFIKGIKYATNNFILLLKPLEILPSKFKQSLPIFLQKASNNYYNIQINDIQTNEKSNEFRLYRNIDNLKNIQEINDYIEFIENQEIVDCSLYLEKIYINNTKGLKGYITSI